MNQQFNQAALRAAATYDAAADRYDAEPLAFWARHGQHAVDLAELTAGESVLDAGCGSGASAIPASRQVGPAGRVLAIDVAGSLLSLARQKAAALGVPNIAFEHRDMTLFHPREQFDAVLAVFSIFFVRDMESLVSHLWSMVRPGGRLVVTTWARQARQPAGCIFAEELARLRPFSVAQAQPWQRLVEPVRIERLFADAGASRPVVQTHLDHQPLRTPEDFWTMALGSGLRGEIEKLSRMERCQLRRAMLDRLHAAGTRSIETTAHHAVAQKGR